MGFTNRSLTKRNPLLFPRSPRTVESEAFNLGCDARNDLRPIDENPYEHDTRDHRQWSDHIDWSQGWWDADREREANDEGDD